MSLAGSRMLWAGAAVAAVAVAFGGAFAQQAPRGKTSYAPVDITEPFSSILARLSAEKPEVERQHMAVLNERYDLSDRPATGVTMDRVKPVQGGIRVKLSAGSTWETLAGLPPEQIRDQNLFPKGFYPLPHPKHQEGGMVFPRFLIDAIKQQEGRDLTRFDVDFDIPDHFLPEFPPPIYLNQRTDLGDVSQGKLVTIANYYERPCHVNGRGPRVARASQVSSCRDSTPPLRGRFGSEDPQRRSGDQVALKIEVVVDGSVDAEEALGRSG